MATNADDTNDGEENATDDSRTTEDDLRKLKYDKVEVETDDKKAEDDTAESDDSEKDSKDSGEDDGQTDDDTKDEDSENETSEFVKELPNIQGDTVADYARNLEKAYQESTKEALRLKGLADQAQQDNKSDTGNDSESKIDLSNPLELYAKQKMDKEIAEAFESFQKEYPQAVPGTFEYAAFTNEVAILSGTILQSQKRLASPEELYSKAAVILGWEKGSSPTDKEKLSMAVKGQAAVSKTSSSVKVTPKSKVTPAMIAFEKKVDPTKSDEQIRKELEPYVK